MGKKRIIKKRTARKHVVKSAVKDKLKESAEKFRSAVNGNMSKLEYEQSMMDPRFRAAMMGFNNPASNYNQQISNALHEQETKNNTLIRQISAQNDIANLQKAKHKLKEQLAQEKLQHQTDMTIASLKSGIARNEFEKQNLQQKFQYDNQIQQLNAQIADQQRINQEQQQRFNQTQQIIQTNHDLVMAKLQAHHDKYLRPIQAAIKDIARKSDLENLQFNGANEVADATYQKVSAEFKKQLQDTLQPMQEATAQSKREYELAQQIIDQDKELRKAEHDQVMSELQKQHQDTVNPIKENTIALNNWVELEKERSKDRIELNNALTDKLIAEFKANAQLNLAQLNEKAQTLNNTMKLLDTEITRVQQIKQAKFQLDKAQIESINQPILQQLQLNHQNLSEQYQLNKQYFDEIMKQKDIQIKTAQLEQTVDPTIRDQYFEKLKNEKIETHKLELINAHAEAAHKAYLEKEQLRSKIIENAAKLLTGFKVEDIDKDDFTKTLSDKETDLRKQYVELAKQHELTQRSINYQHKLDDLEFEHAEAAARLNTITQPSQDYLNNIKTAAQTKVRLSHEMESFNQLNNEIGNLLRSNQKTIDDAYQGFQQYLDAHPYMKQTAEEYAFQKYKNKELKLDDFPKVLEIETNKVQKYNDAYSKIPKEIYDNHQKELYELAEKLKNDGVDIFTPQYQMDTQLEANKTEINELHQQRADLQHRYKQLHTFSNFLNDALISNGIHFTEEGIQQIRNATQLDDPSTLLEPLPDNNPNPA